MFPPRSVRFRDRITFLLTCLQQTIHDKINTINFVLAISIAMHPHRKSMFRFVGKVQLLECHLGFYLLHYFAFDVSVTGTIILWALFVNHTSIFVYSLFQHTAAILVLFHIAIKCIRSSCLSTVTDYRCTGNAEQASLAYTHILAYVFNPKLSFISV